VGNASGTATVEPDMTTLEQLRARGAAPTTVTTPDGTFSGYINQALLGEGTVFALLGETPDTAPDEALCVALNSIQAVASAN